VALEHFLHVALAEIAIQHRFANGVGKPAGESIVVRLDCEQERLRRHDGDDTLLADVAIEPRDEILAVIARMSSLLAGKVGAEAESVGAGADGVYPITSAAQGADDAYHPNGLSLAHQYRFGHLCPRILRSRSLSASSMRAQPT